MSILIENVTKHFGQNIVLDGINLEIKTGSLVALLGGSGSGKSTLLRVVAGFEEPTTGRIWLNGKDSTILSIQEKEIGFVFQAYALFQHLTVYENIAFGLSCNSSFFELVSKNYGLKDQLINYLYQSRSFISSLLLSSKLLIEKYKENTQNNKSSLWSEGPTTNVSRNALGITTPLVGPVAPKGQDHGVSALSLDRGLDRGQDHGKNGQDLSHEQDLSGPSHNFIEGKEANHAGFERKQDHGHAWSKGPTPLGHNLASWPLGQAPLFGPLDHGQDQPSNKNKQSKYSKSFSKENVLFEKLVNKNQILSTKIENLKSTKNFSTLNGSMNQPSEKEKTRNKIKEIKEKQREVGPVALKGHDHKVFFNKKELAVRHTKNTGVNHNNTLWSEGNNGKRSVEELLRLVGLEELAHRYPSQLSGGQCQRVALARALAVQPKVLLLDEPFGALDTKVRKNLRRWLRQLHERVGVTTLFVTHDHQEAMEVANEIVVLEKGRVKHSLNSPQKIFSRLTNKD